MQQLNKNDIEIFVDSNGRWLCIDDILGALQRKSAPLIESFCTGPWMQQRVDGSNYVHEDDCPDAVETLVTRPLQVEIFREWFEKIPLQEEEKDAEWRSFVRNRKRKRREAQDPDWGQHVVAPPREEEDEQQELDFALLKECRKSFKAYRGAAPHMAARFLQLAHNNVNGTSGALTNRFSVRDRLLARDYNVASISADEIARIGRIAAQRYRVLYKTEPSIEYYADQAQGDFKVRNYYPLHAMRDTVDAAIALVLEQ